MLIMQDRQAERALQRLACVEDWLGRLKTDVASGHNRDAFLHLMSAQAEMRLLQEQLGPALGWVEATDPEPVRQPSGLGFRSPLSWLPLAAAAMLFGLISGPLLPHAAAPVQIGAPGIGQVEPVTELAQAPAPAMTAAPEVEIPIMEPVLPPQGAPKNGGGKHGPHTDPAGPEHGSPSRSTQRHATSLPPSTEPVTRSLPSTEPVDSPAPTNTGSTADTPTTGSSFADLAYQAMLLARKALDE
ncbi:MAG: hypothetical protein ABI743_00045 [bacterium]